MKKTGAVMLVLLLSLSIADSLAAQITARLRGQVTDGEGVPLSGVRVTVSGEALLGAPRTTTTGERGTYSFAALPPGLYDVQAELEDHQTKVTEGVRAGINAVATVDFQLLSEFTEEMVVTGDSPLVETTSSSFRSSYGSEFIEDLPLNRYYWDMMVLSPGVTSNFEDNSNALIAFGAGAQNHAWSVDGLSADAPFLGASWWYINPDTIEEVQVLGVGASAEFGNMLGAAFNVVTKSGSNDLKGTFNYYWQDDALTDSNVTLDDSEFPEYHRDRFVDTTATLGGPLKRDRAWFFLAAQYYRDAATEPGVNPEFAALNESDRFDVKLNWRPDDRSTLDVKLHWEDWVEGQQGAVTFAPESLVDFQGDNPAWGLNYGRVLGDRTYLEARYGGWTGDMANPSRTGSTEPALIDYSPGNGLPFFVSGGPLYPFTFDNSRQQADVVVSNFAEGYLGDHDLKFGIGYSTGESETVSALGPGGTYYSTYVYAGTRYDYKYYQTPYVYGSDFDSISAYVDDSWQVNDKLTLNLGVRWDSHEGHIPSYPRLDADLQPTGELLPGVDSALDWDHLSPRLGFAYNTDGRTVVRGSFGVYYDDVITGNWDFPPPGLAPFQTFLIDPATGTQLLIGESLTSTVEIDPDLDAPRSLQYTLGFDRQIGRNMTFGAQLVYKDTENLTGWEIMDDGVYEEISWTNPITGEQETLLGIVEAPTVRKGDQAGFTVLGPDTQYYQDYRGLILTFRKRYSDGWTLMASYTLSRSEGLIPRQFSNFQNNIMLSSRNGTDPNQFLNAEQVLQGDRPHMFRVQGSFDLPWGLVGTASINLQSGRPFARQERVRLPQGRVLLMTVAGNDDQRYGFQEVVDVALGRRFELGKMTLKLDAQVFNLLNDDEVDRWATLIVGENDYSPRSYLAPRRLMLRLGLEF